MRPDRLGCVERFIPACAGNTTAPHTTSAFSPVHPRVRGEHEVGRKAILQLVGSSPRARGTRRSHRACPRASPVHPRVRGEHNHAGVEQTPYHGSSRVRGEHVSRRDSGINVAGSSPRARGTHLVDVELIGQHRFIPACAGNTGWRSPAAPTKSVHPRVRGEHEEVHPMLEADDGSSPRARGTPGFEPCHPIPGRFIPACAGNTAVRQARGSSRPVHPRVRGEHGGRLQRAIPAGRFIPACAGNTAASAMRVPSATGSSPRARGTPPPALCACPAPPVHPRVRGEHARGGVQAGSDAGSSPRARGTPAALAGAQPRNRFIPRVRGEHLKRRQAEIMLDGSSPRARGTLVRLRPEPVHIRFIPACAGNTSTLGTVQRPPNGSSPRARGTPHAVQHRGCSIRFIPACAGNTGSR